MDEKEQGQLNEIHGDVGAINERTRNIERYLEDLDDGQSKNREDINDLQDSVKRNTTIINAVTVGLSGVVLWVSDKVGRLNIL